LEFQTFNGKEAVVMSRPAAHELTQRELEVMHLFWTHGALTAAVARDKLAEEGRDLTYTTVANLIRLLCDKGFLHATNGERPFAYAPLRSRNEVSRRLLGNIVDCVFRGSREQLLLQLFDERHLTKKERALLQSILEEDSK
jgi:predicted transcriptional regulator